VAEKSGHHLDGLYIYEEEMQEINKTEIDQVAGAGPAQEFVCAAAATAVGTYVLSQTYSPMDAYNAGVDTYNSCMKFG